MSGSVFKESGLVFQFPASWTVFKYDEHRFYSYLSGSGLKGIDFIAIHGNELILIEVKNYTDRIVKENFDPMKGLLSEPETYVEHYWRKFEDTFRLLDIIELYYHRKWWYRLIFQRFKTLFSKKETIKTETGFWSRAIEILQTMEGVRLVLWLELAPSFDSQEAQELHDYFQKALRAKAPKSAQVFVAHSKRTFDTILAKRV